jgi:3-methyladenine DNA glycosylase Tag
MKSYCILQLFGNENSIHKNTLVFSKENSMNIKQDEPWDMRRHAPMPRPEDDDGYFEQMSRSVFLAGLNWKVIDKKWPDIKRLFDNFAIDDVAQFNDEDIDRLLKDEGMIRSAKKITAVVANAQTMQKVEQEFGSFAKYLQAVKAKSEEALLKDLHKRFAFLGESTSLIFLFSVGEEMPETLKRIQAAHGSK